MNALASSANDPMPLNPEASTIDGGYKLKILGVKWVKLLTFCHTLEVWSWKC